MSTDHYDHLSIERKWQARWTQSALFRTRQDPGRQKYYYLDMYPYPSGALHMGHIKNYTIGDVITRFHVMRGENVLHPMGWDAFGLPAENAAIKNAVHPDPWTRDCIAQMKEAMDRLGFSFDWNRELASIDPNYYRWNQWFFLKFYERGLAYKKKAPVNWCGQCATVLANEQVKNGLCERCDTPVRKKQLEQWFFKTTDYAKRLLDDLDRLEHWPERVRTMQRNWIGRSEGVQFKLKIAGTAHELEVFTTRIDTVFGVTYVVLAPEHPLIEDLVRDTERAAEVGDFVQECLRQSVIERSAADVEKRGLFTGSFAINPVNGEEVPIWIANYVLMEYGTGAIMAVPAHDQRDFQFARKYDLPIRVVIQPAGETPIEPHAMAEAYVGDGVQANSGRFDALPNQEAMRSIAEWMEARALGTRTVQYRLRDWCLSRQRYWGTPIPIIYCEQCGTVPVPEDQLPVLLPLDVEFKVGENPLLGSAAFQTASCPRCGGGARRETDTMDTFVDSAWYFLRFASPDPLDLPFRMEEVEHWLPVDQYVGGIEHATMHLIYARFFTKALRDLGLISFDEPFARLFTQGMVNMRTFYCEACGQGSLEIAEADGGTCLKCGSPRIARHSEKMSKSIGNLVTADFVLERYGADTGRMYSLFMGPPDQDVDWPVDEVHENGCIRIVPSLAEMEGVSRFLNRIWRLAVRNLDRFVPDWADRRPPLESLTGTQKALHRKTHQTILKVLNDVDRFAFNTAIAALMEWVNQLTAFAGAAFASAPSQEDDRLVFSEAVESLVVVLSPFAPHLADELWNMLEGRDSTQGAPPDPFRLVYARALPVPDENAAREEEITIAVQINGRVRFRLEVPAGLDTKAVQDLILGHPTVQSLLNGKQVQSIHVVPDRLVNIVLK